MPFEYINSHQAEFWIAFGFFLLVIEILVMGFSTLFLFFVGLGALITGLLMQTGVLPETWLAGISSLGICSLIVTLILWRPMHNMQGQRKPRKDVSSDFIGLEFTLTQDVSLESPGAHRYSGISWRVELAPDAGVSELSAGQKVMVTAVEVGMFKVKPAD